MSVFLLSLPLIALAILLTGGCLLLVWGLRGRRFGDEPRCRKCGYNLTGLTSERCPECGSAASNKNVLIGQRRRRPGALALGLLFLFVCIVTSGLGYHSRVKGVGWYQFLPTFVLVRQAKADTARAVHELIRRHSFGDMPDQEIVKLIPLALLRQASESKEVHWTEFLAAMDYAGLLMKEQQQRFYDQMVQTSVRFRPRVRHGEELVFHIWCRSAGHPLLTSTYRIDCGELSVGDRKWEFGHMGDGELSTMSRGASEVVNLQTDQVEPGRYEVRFRAAKLFLAEADSDWDSPSLSADIDLTYELEILHANAPDPVRLVDDPSLAADFKKAIRISASHASPHGVRQSGRVQVAVTVNGALPMDAVFRVYACCGGTEVDLGTVNMRRSASYPHSTWKRWDIESLDVDFFVPILRTSAEAARKTSDIFEIWDGELRFDPVRLPG